VSRIQNPLAGISKASLLQDVNDFASKHGLLDVLPLLRKGALVAQDPNSYDEIGGAETLDDSEVDALRDEVLHKWKQSSSLYITVIMVSRKSGQNKISPILKGAQGSSLCVGGEPISYSGPQPVL
jgi:hypothetical protein